MTDRLDTPRCLLQGGPISTGTLLKEIRECATMVESPEVTVVTAFASYAGVSAILDTLDNAEISQAKWLIGMDGIITEPSALDLIYSWPQTSRSYGWRNDGGGRTLHAKVFSFFDSEASHPPFK